MNDKIRSQIFGYPFGTSFHSNCTGRFEYFEVYVESGALLNRHIDYKNDHDKFYKYGCSYSYLINSQTNGELYRVNFIMTSRLVCGKFMREMKLNSMR
jgi:hypothetical protein